MDVLSFINRYEKILKEKHIPKKQFYSECKISDSAVSQWRTGKNNPATKTIARIAEYLEVTTEYLLTGVETKKEPAPEGVELTDLQKKAMEFVLTLSDEELKQFIRIGEAMIEK